MPYDRKNWFHLRDKWRFEGLLLILVGFLGIGPFVDNNIVTGLLASFVLISAMTALSEGRFLTRVGWSLAILSIVALWAADITGRVDLVIASGFADIAFYLLMTTVILTFVFQATEVTREVLSAAICAYLLLGIGWANFYVLIESFAPGSFTSGALASQVPGGIEDVHSQQGHFTYLSLVTLSTLGYGDITPISQPARMFAALEAIFGQLFIGVLIARLVGQQIKPKGNNT